MTALRDVVEPFTIWVIGCEDVGQETRAALEFVWARRPASTGRVSNVQCFTINGSVSPSGPVHAILATADYRTWARGRHGSTAGPPYLRNTTFPWGLPWITGPARDELERANQKVRDTLGLLHTLSSQHPSAQAVFLFPECFGPAEQGHPASIWLLPELRQWARRAGWVRSAVFQCEMDVEQHRYPCGLLSSEVIDSARAHRGWPQFRAHDGKYLGPLPPECACGRAHEPPLRSSGGSSTNTSPIRPGLLRWLCSKFLKTGLLRTGRPRADTQQARRTPSPSTDSSAGETWITASSSASSASSASGSAFSPRRGNSSSNHLSKSHLKSDHELSLRLGLLEEGDRLSNTRDKVLRSPVLNVKDKEEENYVYKVPTVKAWRLKGRGCEWGTASPPQLLRRPSCLTVDLPRIWRRQIKEGDRPRSCAKICPLPLIIAKRDIAVGPPTRGCARVLALLPLSRGALAQQEVKQMWERTAISGDLKG